MSECARCNGWGVDDVTGFACPSCRTVKQSLTAEVAEYVPRGGDHVMIWVNQRRTDLGGYCIDGVPRHIAPKLVAAIQADTDLERIKRERDQAVEALRSLRQDAALLLSNAEGCAANHYGHDMELLGMPGWLVTVRINIKRATTILASIEGAGHDD